MFDIGFWEIVLIGIVGLVVIGPERLPEVARTLGKWVGRTRRFINQVKADVGAELKQEELRKAIENNADLNELKQIMNTEHFTLEDEEDSFEEPDYQVKAIDDEVEAIDSHDTGKKPAPTSEKKKSENQASPATDTTHQDKTDVVSSKSTDTPVDHEHKA